MKKTSQYSVKMFRWGLVALVSLVLNLSATAEDFSRNFSQKFDVDKNATLLIDNQFGDVLCQNWDQQAISIDVTIKVEASSQEKANKVFDKISIYLKGDRSKVQGITSLASMSMNNVQFSINYTIKMPRSVNVDLTCQFGDLFVDAVEGSAKIRVEHSDMEANSFNGTDNNFNIKFGDAAVKYIKQGSIAVEHGELRLDGANNMDIRSRFSELDIKKMEDLNLDSQNDEVSIEKAGAVKLVSRFSDVEIGNVMKDFSLDVQYGEVMIRYIAPGFNTGKVNNTFAGVILGFDPAVRINVDARMQFGKLSYPKESAEITYRDEGYTSSFYKGTIGKGGSLSTLLIQSQNCDVSILLK